MDKGASIQEYFMRITQVKNDFLYIGEVIADKELTRISLGGLTRPWETFVTTILNNERIAIFNDLLVRCTQEEIMMMERDKYINGCEPTYFSTHSKRRNYVGHQLQEDRVLDLRRDSK